jgi:hypothetical protein
MIQHEQHSTEVTVQVFIPRLTEPKLFTWPLTLTVGQAAKEAADAFGYSQSSNPTLGRGNHTFDRNKTLEQEHIHNNEELELLDVGGGV